MTKLHSLFLSLGLATVAAAQPPTVQISIGVRETGFAGGSFTSIGGNGGSGGGIEWINRDGQFLTLDGTWQLFTFNLTTDPIASFAGASANGLLEGTFGTLEHVRVLNSGGVTDPITLHIDDVANTITPMGMPPTTTTFGDFQGFPSGAEVMFQEPPFSGSTSGHVVAGGTSGADNQVASRSASCRFDFQFVDGMTSRWVRLTTFNAINQPNPLIRFDDSSVVTFWMRGGDCQEDLGSQGPGTAYSEVCGWGMNTGESSTYDVAAAPASAPGALAISLAGKPDVGLLGGNLVSGTGLIVGLSIGSDAMGRFTLPLPGQATVVDLALQSLFLDNTLPQGLAFTNAIKVKLGQ